MDTHSELMGYVGECYFCGEGIMEWEEHTALFQGWCHDACARENDDAMEAMVEQGD